MKTTPWHSLDILQKVSNKLMKKGISESEKEAEILICHAFNIDRGDLYRDALFLSDANMQNLNYVVQKRLRREPLEYLIGYIEFYGLKIKVGRGVFIPRPETEILVEEAIKIIEKLKVPSPDIIDVGTGAGCIAIAIAKYVPSAKVIGIDISDISIKFSRDNSISNGVKDILFMKGDLFSPVRGRKFNLIISNPPYIEKNTLFLLQREVIEYEPLHALYGGEDGLNFYRRIIKESPNYLEEEGFLLFEIGYGQDHTIEEIARENGLKSVKTVSDLAGIKRVMILKKG